MNVAGNHQLVLIDNDATKITMIYSRSKKFSVFFIDFKTKRLLFGNFLFSYKTFTERVRFWTRKSEAVLKTETKSDDLVANPAFRKSANLVPDENQQLGLPGCEKLGKDIRISDWARGRVTLTKTIGKKMYESLPQNLLHIRFRDSKIRETYVNIPWRQAHCSASVYLSKFKGELPAQNASDCQKFKTRRCEGNGRGRIC